MHRKDTRLLYGWMAFILMLLLMRMYLTESRMFAFLAWNLLLAWIPYVLSKRLMQITHKTKGWFLLLLVVLFLPNAPYIITDLVHLKKRPDIPFYFDMILVTACSLCGLFMGLLAIDRCCTWWRYRMPQASLWVFKSALFLLCGFGIYLGRYERFNSWDLLTQPHNLLAAVLGPLVRPLAHLHTWSLTLLFGAFLFLCYETLLSFTSREIK
jgi:uncharacterized membrane protein